MKKSVVASVVVLVLTGSWLGATWYSGKRIEEAMPARMAFLNEKLDQALPGFGVKLEQISHQRGFFAGSGRYELTMLGPKGAQSNPLIPKGVVQFEVKTDYGPFPPGALSRGIVGPRLAFVHAELVRSTVLAPWFDVVRGQPPLSNEAIVSYGGDTASMLTIAPVHVVKGADKLDFNGAQVEGSYKQSTSAMKALMSNVSLAMSTGDPKLPDGSFRLDGLGMNVDVHRGHSGIMVGSSAVSLQHFEAGSRTSAFKLVSLDDVRESVEAHETGDTINGEISYRIGGLKINSADIGGGNLVFKLGGMNAEAAYHLVMTWRRYMIEYRRNLLAFMKPDDEAQDDSADAPPSESHLAENRDELMKALQAALAGSPTLSMDPLLWKTRQGEAQLNVTVNLQQPPELPAQGSAEVFAAQAVKSIDAKAGVSQAMMRELLALYLTSRKGIKADEANAEAQQQVTSLVELVTHMNWGRVEGDTLLSDFHYADGKIRLHGRETSLNDLFSGDD